jgi:hypothetical protein
VIASSATTSPTLRQQSLDTRRDEIYEAATALPAAVASAGLTSELPRTRQLASAM